MNNLPRTIREIEQEQKWIKQRKEELKNEDIGLQDCLKRIETLSGEIMDRGKVRTAKNECAYIRITLINKR